MAGFRSNLERLGLVRHLTSPLVHLEDAIHSNRKVWRSAPVTEPNSKTKGCVSTIRNVFCKRGFRKGWNNTEKKASKREMKNTKVFLQTNNTVTAILSLSPVQVREVVQEERKKKERNRRSEFVVQPLVCCPLPYPGSTSPAIHCSPSSLWSIPAFIFESVSRIKKNHVTRLETHSLFSMHSFLDGLGWFLCIFHSFPFSSCWSSLPAMAVLLMCLWSLRTVFHSMETRTAGYCCCVYSFSPVRT
jgi:hypothetical protein